MNPDSTRALLAGANALGQLPGSTDGGAFALATPELGPVLLKLVLGLGAVIVLILLLQRIARRFGGGLPRRGDPIQLLAQRPLGPRLSLAVVEVMDRTFLVGVSPHGVERVADLTAARARQRAAHSLLEEERNQNFRTEVLEGLSWKERLVRSFARVLSGGKMPAAANGVLESSDPLSAATHVRNRARSSTRTQTPPPSGRGGEEQAAFTDSDDRSRETGFEDEFRRRLGEIQARYPQISEIETPPATPRSSR